MAELIPRILFQRKSFLNITEESLQQEIENQDSLNEVSGDGELTQEDEKNNNNLEKIQSLKHELAQNIGLALNETSLSLDFVSLLISVVKPNLSKSTMSPHLSKTVPIGSLNSDRLQNNDELNTQDEKIPAIGQGWKYESINKVQGLLKTSSTKLNEKVIRGGVYWNTINKILNNDEILIKMRDPLDNSRAIGVKYGYGDSGSRYHNKGIAVLRTDENTGEVSFNPIQTTNGRAIDSTFKFIRVKILSKIDDTYMLTGQSKLDYNKNMEDGQSKLINEIERARYFIFEEDLFYHLLKEAKTLANYGVLIISDKIIIEINNEIIEIESVTYDDNNEEELKNMYQTVNDDSTKNNQKCQYILNFLKIMLCCFFKYNLGLKQKIPTNYTKFKQYNSHPLILRPLIGNINHETYIKTLKKMLDKQIDNYKQDIEVDIQLNKFENITNITKIDNPFIKSIERPITTLEVKVKRLSDNSYLKIDLKITTSEIFVNLVLDLKVIKFAKVEHLNDNEKGTNVLQLTFNDFTEIEQCLNWSIKKFLIE